MNAGPGSNCIGNDNDNESKKSNESGWSASQWMISSGEVELSNLDLFKNIGLVDNESNIYPLYGPGSPKSV